MPRSMGKKQLFLQIFFFFKWRFFIKNFELSLLLSEFGSPLTRIKMLNAIIEKSTWSVVDDRRDYERVGSIVEIDTKHRWA